MSVRTAWHTRQLDVASDDPFAPAVTPRIEQVGTPIALAGELAGKHARLVALVTDEARLEHAGVSCKIKDAHETSCHACPLYRADGSPMAQLCAIGREQERLCTEIVARQHGG